MTLGTYDGSCWKTAGHKYMTTWIGTEVTQELYWVNRTRMERYVRDQRSLGYEVRVSAL